MELFLTMLSYTVPALVVLLAVVIMMRRMFRMEDSYRNFELLRERHRVVSPVRLRAYERLTLLLERTQPTSMIMRQNIHKMTCLQLQTALQKQIREEFEHNVAQQIYVSHDAWVMVCNAKESLLQLVNLSAAQFEPNASAMRMAEFMINRFGEVQNPPSVVAINFLRNEIKREF